MKYLKYLLFAAIFLLPVSAQAFSDLPETDVHYVSLTYLEYEGVIGGYDDGSVRPNNQINRAELVKILVEGLGKTTKSTLKNCFPDGTEDWYAKYVCYAREKDWIAGYPDGTFQPSQNVNKAEALKIIMNAFGMSTTDPRGTLFNDVDFSAWYAPFLQVAKDKGLIEEAGNYFSPGNFRSRGEVAEMVARIMQIDYMDDAMWTEEIGAEFGTFLLLLKLRKDNGVTTPLRLKKELTMAARDHAKDMAEVIGDMAHIGSDGSQPHERVRKYYDYPGRQGENVGKGPVNQYRSAYKAVSDVHYNIFMPEPHECHNHRTTILATCLNFIDVGIGVATKNGMAYFAEDFTTGDVELSQNNSSMELPSEYSASQYDVTEDPDGEYTFVKVNRCNNDLLRLEYFIDAGVYLKDGQCIVYEIALNPDGSKGFNVMPDEVYDNLLVNLSYTSNIYGDTTIQFDEAYIKAGTSSYSGWEITSHVYPYDFNIGDTVDISLKKDSQTATVRLDFSEEGWVRIQKI